MLASRSSILCSPVRRVWSIWHIPHATLFTGRATPNGTQSYGVETGQSTNVARTVLPRANWSVTRIGFSGCKLKPDESEHNTSLKAALSTLTNFVSVPARAEPLLGKTLASLFNSRDLSREQVVIAVKMGVVLGSHIDTFKSSAKQADVYNKNIEHHKYMYSIDPDFLKSKIDDSLKTLDLDCLDLVILEDPVFNFLDSHEGRIDEMYSRITKAFEYLENEVKTGRVQYYGISSDSFILPSSSPRHLSLSKLLDIVKQHNFEHFAAIEYPHNIAENGALTLLNNNNNSASVCQLAKVHNLMQIGHRPLTINQHGRQFRLKTLSSHPDRDIIGLMNESFRFASALEQSSPVAMQHEIGIDFKYPDIHDVIWTQHLGANLVDGAHYLYKYLNWVEFEARPRLNKALKQLAQNERFVVWTVRYKAALDSLFTRCQWALERVSCDIAQRIERMLTQKSPHLEQLDLTQQALRVALSGGPDLILCGMRAHNHLVHLSQLDQNVLLSENELVAIFSDTYTKFMKTDNAVLWLEPGESPDTDREVFTVSFGDPTEPGSLSDTIQKTQAANPIKSDSPIY